MYYGDEAGLQGCADPFNRRTYPWGREDEALRAQVKALIALRNGERVLHGGHMRLGALSPQVLCLVRYDESNVMVLLVNGSDAPAEALFYPALLYAGPDGDVPVPLSGVYRELGTEEVLKVYHTLQTQLAPGTYKIFRKDIL